MAGGGKSVRSPFSVARKEPSPSREESSSEEVAKSEAAGASRGGSKERGRKRSHAERGRTAKARRHNRDPSHSYVQRNLRRKHRREGDRRHRRHRRSHRSRRDRSVTPDKRRRSASSGRGAARPPEPSTGPSKTGTKKCPHCWAEVTVQPSGRAQHQWSNRTCLQWQFYNEMDPELKKKNETMAWNKAKEPAATLYERRRYVAAPHALEAEMSRVPLPPVMLRSRSSLRAKAAPDEMEDVAVEEAAEELQRPLRSGQGQAPAASGSTGSKGQGHGPPAEPPAVKTETPGSSQKQQIVINITSS